jgi:hypothetical protein
MSTILTGRSVLIVEDEPLIAMEIVQAFELAGARLVLNNTRCPLRCLIMASAMVTVQHYANGSRNLTSRSCFIAAITTLDGPCREAPFVPKPASPDVLVTTLEGLLRGRGQTINA